MTARTLTPAGLAPTARRNSVRVGPAVSVVFEDRQTLWLRMRELQRAARKSGTVIDRQLDWYRRLMPAPGRWPAAVWLGRTGSRATPDLTRLRAAISTGHFELVSTAGDIIPAVHLPHRHTDRLGGLIGWIEFRYDPASEAEFADGSLGWQLHLDADDYTHQSESLVRTGDGFAPSGD